MKVFCCGALGLLLARLGPVDQLEKGLLIGVKRTRITVRQTPLTSRAEELHLRALPEPYVNLSIHTAPDVGRCYDIAASERTVSRSFGLVTQPFVFLAHPADDIDIDPLQGRTQPRLVELAVVVGPAFWRERPKQKAATWTPSMSS